MKHHESSFQYHRNSINKTKKKRNSNFASPTGNILDLTSNNSELKRFVTNEGKNTLDIENSQISLNIINRRKKSTKRQSLKFIQKNIQNKILDMSMKIEKEENIASGVSKENNNLNLSAFIIRQIEGENDYIPSPRNRTHNSIKLKNKERKSFKLDESNVILKKDTHNNSISRVYNQKHNEKFRILLQKNIIYDSFNSEEEKENEEPRFYISPRSRFVLVFDFLIILSSLFDLIYTPYHLSRIEGFCDTRNSFVNFIYYCIDILYILDLLLGFVRSYYNFQFVIIKYKPRIARHYIVTQFWFDFFQAFPAFSIIRLMCKSKNINCGAYNLTNKQMFLLLFCFVKQVKLFKIIDLKKNSIMFKINDIISDREFTENIFNFLINASIIVFCFYSFISIHIFIGRHSYPNWIMRNGFQDQSNLLLYLTSFYYLITTMTTVGYGDIVVASFTETVFQIIVLSVGITVYSWIVSNIGNYVKNESYASMRFNKDGTILEEIRISHPNMPFRLYKQIFQHLNARKIRQQQCDSNLLINSLPYSLKNSILLTIYKQTINNLKIFRKCNNSDFILRLLNNFIPLFSKKNAILIHEGQLIENIIFVKNGRLALQAAIDIDEPEESIKNHLDKNFGDISEDGMFLSKYESSNTSASLFESKANQTPIDIARTVIDTVVNMNTRTKSALTSEINESGIGKEMGKWDYGGEDFEESNYQFLNIINISKNESYGVVYMFLTKPSPLSLRVKSKKVELLLLRKADATDISQRYPNIWMKYLKKSYFNTLSIKKLAINKLKHFWENLERKTKPKNKRPIQKSKTNHNPCTIYKLKNSDMDTLKKYTTSKNLQLKKCKTQRKIKQNNLKENTINKSLNCNDNKNSFSLSTNFSNQYTSYLSATNKISNVINDKSKNNIKNGNMKLNTNKIFGVKSPKNKTHFNRNNQISKRNARHQRNNYVGKLKSKLKKLRNSKKYYKKLCHTLTMLKGINNNYNSALMMTTLKKDSSTFGLTGNINPNVNIFNSVKPNIINNITIKNSNKFLFKSKNEEEESNNSESSNSILGMEKSNKKFNLEEMEINSEINLFFKSKYTNLETFTSGEFSKNEELRKQSLNFIKMLLDIDKKHQKKLKNSSFIIPNNKIENPYINNYDFRYILNKLNFNKQRKNSVLRTTILKKEKFLLTGNAEDKSNSSFLTLVKNDNNYQKRSRKKTLSKETKRKSIKRNKSRASNKEYRLSFIKKNKKCNQTIINSANKINHSISMDESKDKKDNTTITKLPIKVKIVNELENENILTKQINENDLSKLKSFNSEENINDSSILNNKNELNNISDFQSINNLKKSNSDSIVEK